MKPSDLEILYEDNHIIAINKPAGELVQGDRTGDEPLSEVVKQYIKKKYNKPGAVYLGVTHRLDRPTSGVLLFARTSKALARLNDQFKNREIRKTYWAVVQEIPRPESGELTHYLIKNQKLNKSKAFGKPAKGALKANLSFQMIKKIDRYCLLEVNPKTGRHHQIRVQLSTIGCPIKGDVKYGFKRTNPDGSIHLHARKVSFLHPVKKEKLTIEAPSPDETVWNAFGAI